MTDFVTFNRFVITSDDDQWPRGKPRSITARLVLFLVATSSPRTPTDLARLTGLRKTTVGSVLDQLVDLGLVLRETPPRASHRRRVIVLPTEKAKEIVWDLAA